LISKGRRVAFGDFALNSTEVSIAPKEEGFERYIIGKHIPLDGPRVTSWNPIGDFEFGPRIRTIFRPGDVICTTRGPNLRVVTVDFPGLCAHTNFVLRTLNPELLMQPYLEATVRSEGFQHHLKTNFRGSVNLFVNWSDAARYEFVLPPKHVQERASRILRSFEAASERIANTENALTDTLDTLAQWYATAGLRPLDTSGVVRAEAIPDGWSLKSIRELCTGGGGGLTLGPFGSALKVDDYGHLSSGTPVLFVQDVGRFDLRHHSGRFISAAKHEELAGHEAVPGDVLVTEMGWPPGEACVVPPRWPASIIKADIIRARVNHSLVAPEYLELVLNSHWGQQQIVRISPGTTRPRMTLRDFEQLTLAVPPSHEQVRAIERIRDVRARSAEARRRIQATQSLKTSAFESVLETA
jgi:restriction endonuclease S subunit